MSFLPEPESQSTPGTDEAPDLGSGEVTYITGGEKKPQNTQTMVLMTLVAVAAGVIYFMYFRPGPQLAGAAEVAGADTVKTFLASGEEHVQLMRQMLQNTDKVVQQFRAYPSRTQVPLASLHTNPFRQLLPTKAQAKREDESEAAARRRLEEERQAAVAAVSNLRLQSVIQGKFPACMVNNKMYQQGEQVDGILIEQITADSIIVRSGVFRFEVGMPGR